MSLPTNEIWLRIQAGDRYLRELLGGAGSMAAGPLNARSILGIGSGAAALYGVALGSFDLRPMQMLYSGLKLPALFAGTGVVCLPFAVALCCVMGQAALLRRFVRALAIGIVAQAVCLAACAPLTWLWYRTSGSYPGAFLWNAVVFLAGFCGGEAARKRALAPMLQTAPSLRLVSISWALLYAFVAFQCTWMLRPFIGTPNEVVTFLRDDTWGNAYVQTWHAMRRSLGIS